MSVEIEDGLKFIDVALVAQQPPSLQQGLVCLAPDGWVSSHYYCFGPFVSSPDVMHWKNSGIACIHCDTLMHTL